MKIIRDTRKEQGYTTISNVILKDKRLSLKAKGLFIQMLSLPENWALNAKGMAQLNKDGEKAILTAFKELEEYGYLVRTKYKKENFYEWNNTLYENPIDREISNILRNAPTLEEFTTFCYGILEQEECFINFDAEYEWGKQEKRGWTDSRGNPLKDWKTYYKKLFMKISDKMNDKQIDI